MPDEDDIVISDQIYFDLEDLAQCQECLKKYNTKMNTPGYGMLSESNYNFVTSNRNYKRTDSRSALNRYYNYYTYDPYGGGYIDPAQEGSSEAYGILSRTIRGLAQFNAAVNKEFMDPKYGGEFGPPEKELVSKAEFMLDNFMDGFIVDSINGITAYINEERISKGLIPYPYMYRLGAGDTLGLERHLEEALATGCYAAGAVTMNATLKSLDAVDPGLGTALAKMNSMVQGTGVMVSYSLADDGIVSRGELVADIVIGSSVGLALDAGADKLTKIVPVHVCHDVAGIYLGGYLGAGIEEFTGSGNALLVK